MIREYANLMLERRRGTIGVVPTQALAAGINPTPAEVAAFYQRSRASFTIPERRVIRYAMIGPRAGRRRGARDRRGDRRFLSAERGRLRSARDPRPAAHRGPGRQRGADAGPALARRRTSFPGRRRGRLRPRRTSTFSNQTREQFDDAGHRRGRDGRVPAQPRARSSARSAPPGASTSSGSSGSTARRRGRSRRCATRSPAPIEQRKQAEALDDLDQPHPGAHQRRRQRRARSPRPSGSTW